MNTVLAFVSARKQLALSFSVVRSSIEGLLKRYITPAIQIRLYTYIDPDHWMSPILPKSSQSLCYTLMTRKR